MHDVGLWWSQQSLPSIEWWAVGLALVYVVLAAKNSSWCWPFALISSCLWAWQVFYAYQLYFDAVLNVFYAIMAMIGLYEWSKHPGEGAKVSTSSGGIQQMKPGEHLRWMLAGVIATGVLTVLAKAYTAAALPLIDAFTTIFSIIGTILLVKRKLDNWLYLMAMDAIYVWLYIDRGSVLFAALFVLYCVLAFFGFLNWRRIMQQQQGV